MRFAAAAPAVRSYSSSSASSTRATATRRARRWPTGARPARRAPPPGGRRARGRAPRHDRERTYMAEARGAAGDDHDHDADENGGYESEAMAVLEAIALNSREVLILNPANRSSLPFLDESAVVEVPCVVGRA